MRYFMKWREDFDDQSGTFMSVEELTEEVERIKSMDGEGEAYIIEIIKGEDVTDEFA